MLKKQKLFLFALVTSVLSQILIPGNTLFSQTAFASYADGVIDDFSSTDQYNNRINDLNQSIVMSVDSWFVYPDAVAIQSNIINQFWQTNINSDVSNRSTLVLRLKDSWVSGTEEHWNVVLNDGSDHSVGLSAYGKVSDSFQDFSIPLSSFNANLGSIKYLKLVHKDNAYAQLHIDKIVLTGSGTEPTPTSSPTATASPTPTPTVAPTTTPTATPTPATTSEPTALPQDITESGFISVSDIESPGGEEANKAFDNDTDTKWLTYHQTGWIQYQFLKENKYIASSYSISSANDYDDRDPKSWVLKGSNDGIAWTDLDSRDNQNFDERFQTKTYTIDESKQLPFSIFKIEFTDNHGGGFLQVSEIQIFGTKQEVSTQVDTGINAKWESMGGENGILGSPASSESMASDGIGYFRDYQGGSIYYYPMAGAFEIDGPIKSKWVSLGAENSVLGYPISDVINTADGIGKYAIFQNGRIYYHPTLGTYYLTGKLYLNWADKGFETSQLGYPESDPVQTNGESTQTFQNGTVSTLDPQLKDSMDLRGEINRRGIAIRNQGSRGTCVPHAIVFLQEYAYTGLLGSKYNHLSIEYADHASNKATGSTSDDSCFPDMEAGYNLYGTISDSEWPYDSNLVYNYNEADLKMTPALINEGASMVKKGLKFKGRYIKKDGLVITDAQLDDVINCLNRGIPVAEASRGHAMGIVGYVKNASEDGGGHFIIRNSYGITDGDQGYVTLTFGYFKTVPSELYLLEGLEK